MKIITLEEERNVILKKQVLAETLTELTLDNYIRGNDIYARFSEDIDIQGYMAAIRRGAENQLDDDWLGNDMVIHDLKNKIMELAGILDKNGLFDEIIQVLTIHCPDIYQNWTKEEILKRFEIFRMDCAEIWDQMQKVYARLVKRNRKTKQLEMADELGYSIFDDMMNMPAYMPDLDNAHQEIIQKIKTYPVIQKMIVLSDLPDKRMVYSKFQAISFEQIIARLETSAYRKDSAVEYTNNKESIKILLEDQSFKHLCENSEKYMDFYHALQDLMKENMLG